MARGRNEFNITHFALADDEVDYSLWNSDHPLGSNYYGVTIENMPIPEAVVDETMNMKYKLVSLPRKTIRIPIISVPNTNITLFPGQSLEINPQTINYTDGNSTFGYTFILADSEILSMNVNATAPGQGYAGQGSPYANILSDSEAGQAITVTGKSVKITANLLLLAAKATTLTVIGNETGGRIVITITVMQQTFNTTPNTPLTGVTEISLP